MPLLHDWTNQTDAAIDEKLGLVAVKVPFTVTPGDSKMATLKHALTFFPSDLDEIGLPMVKREAKERNDGGFDVDFHFDGHFNPDSADGEEFSLEGSTNDEKIEAHPEIGVLVKKYYPGKTLKTAQNENGDIIFPATISGTASANVNQFVAGPQIYGQLSSGGLGNALTADIGEDSDSVPNPLFGVKTYLEPSVVWTRTFLSKDFPEGTSRQLGTIGTAQVGKNGQRPPAGREWILVRVRADWRGNIWRISMSWLQSGRHGFPPDVYRFR
ncbi:MAG: hypothetical protein V4555_16435 [Acidobacteriota bacterium]